MENTFLASTQLQLTVAPQGGTSIVVAAGNIKLLDLHLTNYGWSGTIEFDVVDNKKVQGGQLDELKPSFLKSKIIKVTLDFQSWYDDTVRTEGEIRPAVPLRGIVTKRSFVEWTSDMIVKDKQVLVRRYRIEVADSMRVLWGQHHPCQLYQKQNMKTILNKHTGDSFKLEFDGAPEPATVHPMVFFALDPSIGKASFYDFFTWWLDRHRLVFNYRYDTTTDSYQILQEKIDAAAKPWPVHRTTVQERGLQINFPEVPRYEVNVLDSFTGADIAPKNFPNAENKVAPIRRDTLLRTSHNPEFQDRAQLEKERLVTDPSPELTVTFSKLPSQPLFPGDLTQFTEKESWNSDAWQYNKQFRVFDVRVVATATSADPFTLNAGKTNYYGFNLSYVVKLEPATDKKTPRLPSFVEPVYPVYAEGKILSNVGPATGNPLDETYQVQPAPEGGNTYRIVLPLWKTEAPEITVPYNPGRMPGQLFFPAYKDERVLVALTWRKAWIDSFIDWRKDLCLPDEMQGNHMLLGRTPKSRTTMVNYYENRTSMRPVFKLARISENDRQKIVISEGNMLIEVNEETTPILARVENVAESEQD